jgi:hypothetical protein
MLRILSTEITIELKQVHELSFMNLQCMYNLKHHIVHETICMVLSVNLKRDLT